MAQNPAHRLGFAGTPQFAATILTTLMQQGFKPEVVFCQPDRPSGRGRKVSVSPVKRLALDADIPVRQPVTLKDQSLEPGLDALIVAAYGLILPAHILDAPRFGCINVHASLLPRWRGAAPIERAIMAGDTRTGVTIMQMDKGLDTGPTYNRAEVAIGAAMTGAELEHILAELGARELIECLKQLGSIEPQPQQGTASYASKLTPADSIIHWDQPAAAVFNQVRALTGRMPAVTFRDDVRVRVLNADLHSSELPSTPGQILTADKDGIVVACGDNALRVTRLQLNRGKGKPIDAAAAVNGYTELFTPGSRFDERSGQ